MSQRGSTGISLDRKYNDDIRQLFCNGSSSSSSSGSSRKRPRAPPVKDARHGDDEDEYSGEWDQLIRDTPSKIWDTSMPAATSRKAGFHRPPGTSSPRNLQNNDDVSAKIRANKESLVSTANQAIVVSDENDEFAGIADEGILEHFDTPFKPNSDATAKNNTRAASRTPNGTAYHPMARAVTIEATRKHDPKRSFQSGNGEESNEGHNKSFSQLTQPEYDWDALSEPGEYDICNEDIQDEEEIDVPNNSKAPIQATLSQWCSSETETLHRNKIADFVEYNGRHYMKGDTWQHKEVPAASPNCNFSNLIVTIESFSTAKLRGKREKVANVASNCYLPIQDVEWLASDQAQSVIDHRRSKGRTGPGFVEYQRISPVSSDVKSRHQFPLQMLVHQVKDSINSDLIFGHDHASSTKQGCYFKFKPSPSYNQRVEIPKDANGRYTALELYSGAGGYSLGLKDAGFCVTHHVDSDTAACATLRANFPGSHVLQYRVEDFLTGCLRNPNSRSYPKVGSIALLHGSSPCQGFSCANRNGGANDLANNAETYQFLDVVKHFQPPFVTFENVEGFLRPKNRSYVERMNAELIKMDYQVRVCEISSSDYGDPQHRKRVFILAAKRGLELPCIPTPTHGDGPLLEKKKTVNDAMGYLQDIPPLEYEGEILATPNGSSTPRYLKGHVASSAKCTKDDIYLVSGHPASTVIKRRVMRHYTNNKRPLTRLERASLQSFPPDFEFCGTDTEIRDQIGNAVPVCMARAIGMSVMEAIRQSGG